MNTRSIKLLPLVLAALAFLFFASAAHAQDAAPAGTTINAPADPVLPQTLPDQVVAWLTPLLVPMLIAAVKKVAPKIPSWALPLIAPLLGFLIGVINNLVTAHSTNLWLAAALGLLGVAVREVKEAVKPAANGGWPSTP